MLYRVEPDVIEIVAFIHGARDLAVLMKMRNG
jgi:hypothetical protein